MRVVLAPDKFKGSAPAATVAGALAAGLRSQIPEVEVAIVPVADGGDGMVDAVLACGFGAVEVEVSDALGRAHRTTYALESPPENADPSATSGGAAVVEMAALCGLALLGAERDPLGATSLGLGQGIAAAIAGGARQIIVGIGGSASTDGGAGMLVALGAQLLDRNGQPVPPGGGHLPRIAELDLSGLLPQLAHVQILVACDVDNPLTGPTGAAAIYGPQKGASPADVETLDSALSGWADLVAARMGADLRDVAGAGAAGGVGFAALAVLGATLRPGADLILDLTGLDDALDDADLVITGEGSLDEQTLHGKAPAVVTARAAARGIPVYAVAGQATLTPQALAAAGFARVWTLADRVAKPEDSYDRAADLLTQVGAEMARAAAGEDS